MQVLNLVMEVVIILNHLKENSDNDKHLVFKGDNNINVILGVDDTNKTGTFNVSLKDELTNIKSITLKDNSSIDNKTGKITIDTSGNVKVKHGDSNESKIVVEDNLKVLNGGSEIKVSGAGKVFTYIINFKW